MHTYIDLMRKVINKCYQKVPVFCNQLTQHVRKKSISKKRQIECERGSRSFWHPQYMNMCKTGRREVMRSSEWVSHQKEPERSLCIIIWYRFISFRDTRLSEARRKGQCLTNVSKLWWIGCERVDKFFKFISDENFRTSLCRLVKNSISNSSNICPLRVTFLQQAQNNSVTMNSSCSVSKPVNTISKSSRSTMKLPKNVTFYLCVWASKPVTAHFFIGRL